MTVHKPTPGQPRQLPLIHVSGTPYQIGCQIGESCRDQVRRSLENVRALMYRAYDQLQLNWDGARNQARKYLPFALERYPQYVEEMRGIADGAGCELDDLMVLNALEAVTSDALHLTKCTSIAVSPERSENGHVLLAHNEDWLPEDEQDVFIIHATPAEEPPFLAMTYGGLLPNIGFNAYGIAQCCDSVYPNDSRIGVPRVVCSRSVLAARTPSEAIRPMLSPHRAAGYNHLLVHESGEIYNVEVSARKFAVLSAVNGVGVHTNHYLDPQMQAIEKDPDELIGTRVRYFRAQRLLGLKPKHDIETLKQIQRDHVNYQESICSHRVDDHHPLDREKTITALIMDLTERRLYAAWGNPCENAYFSYDLNA